MKTNVALFAAVSLSVAGGCSLLKVTGTPLGLVSSSSSSNATQASGSQDSGDEDLAAKKDKKWGVWKSPAWCKNADSLIEKSNRSQVMDSDWKTFQEDDSPERALKTLVNAYCFPTDYSRRDVKIVEAGFKKWSAKLSLTEADWVEVVEWMSYRYGGKMKDPDEKTSWRKWSPVDQYLELRGSAHIDSHYIADALDKQLTALGRLGYVTNCVHSKAEAFWAMCQADFDAIDRKAVLTELRADKGHDAYERTQLRLELSSVFADLDEHAKRVKELKAKDPGWVKMFEVAAAARKDWAVKADPKLVELVFEMDDARITNSRKAAEGCHAKTWPAFQALVASIPAKTYGERKRDTLWPALAIIVDSPNGYLTSLAHFYCSSYDPKMDYLARTVGAQLSNTVGFRGPRNAAYTAIASAGIVLDDRDEKIGYPVIQRPIGADGSSNGSSGHGKIASIKNNGDTVVIEFGKEKFSQEECVKGHYTHRIQSISSDGSINYEYICDKLQMMTYNEPSSQPMTVKAIYAGGLTKGMFVDVVEDLVVFGYPKEGVSVPSIVAGVQVK